MLAALIFGAPALLAGLAAVALPVVIHLLMRPRPRRVRFPAIQRVTGILVAGRKAQRVRQWRLLLIRAAALACVPLLLAGPRCAAPADAPQGPVARVIVIDDSASMDYTTIAGKTRGALAREAASEIAAATRAEPAGSELGLVRTRRSDTDTPLTSELVRVEAALRRATTPDASAVAQAAPLGQTVRRAAEMLRAAGPARREIVVVSDQLASAWRDVSASQIVGVTDLAVRLVAIDAEPLSNLAIVNAQLAGPAFAGAPLSIETTVRASGAVGTCQLEITDDEGQTLARSAPEALSDGVRAIPVDVPPLDVGWHALRIRVTPEDRLAFDQERWVAFRVSPRPIVWLIESGRPADALTLRIISALLAPDMLAPERQRVSMRRLSTTIDSAVIDETPALIVTTLSDAGPELAKRIRDAVERGAQLLILPGGAGEDWPALRGLIATTPVAVETLESPQRIRWTADAPLDGAVGIDELTRADVTRRLSALRPVDGARTVAQFEDGAPAWLDARVGQGRVTLIATTPDPAWSGLGARAAGLLTLLHRMAEPERAAVPAFEIGAARRDALFGGVDGRAIVRGPGRTAVTDVVLRGGAPEAHWPAERPGVYMVDAAGGEGRYVVNWPAAESAPEIAVPAELAERLGAPVTMRAPDGVAPGGSSTWTPDAFVTLALLLLALIALETWLSARRAPAPASRATEPG